ncbi:MAG: dihydroneopterin aldolase [Lewinellaceae bacterium]|nr:dihydroneopterin aldolase [Lewinellaceae bacterium]
MAWIALEGMRFHAFHGVYEAEKILGTEYLVDVYVQAQVTAAAKSDKLEKTINYETIYQICRLEMDKPRDLIEAVVGSIIERMKHQFAEMEALRVRLRKMNPPLGGPVEMAWVMEEQNYMKECPRCKSRFIVYDDEAYWASYNNLYDATRENLNKQYGNKPLCPTCMKIYVG